MKKILRINILIIIVLFILTEVYFYTNFMRLKVKGYIFPYICGHKQIYNSLKIKKFPSERFKPYDKSFNKKKPILMLGCSYTYGQWLDKDRNVSSKLQELTNRWVYNLGIVGQGPMISYLLLSDDEKEHYIEEPPEYIIYTYMFHHINRYWYWQYYNIFRKEHFTDFQKFIPIFDCLYSAGYFRNTNFDKYMYDDIDLKKREELFINIMKRIKAKTDKLFPNSKFIFLIYSDINKDLCEGLLPSYATDYDKEDMQRLFDFMYSERMKQDMEELGMQVITTEELLGRKMDKEEDRIPSSIDPNHPHPSEKAWDEILPALIKKLNL